MSCVLLFCIAEEAEAFGRDVLDYGMGDAREGQGSRMFYLVESHEGPQEGQQFKRQLQEDETFDTDFIGATPAECQNWNNERCRYDRAPIGGMIAIVDARSAQDGTILMQKWVQPPAGTPYFTFGGYGPLPQETNVWYDFRVDYRQAGTVVAALIYVAPDVTYPIWYGNKERFTNENGVFYVQEADRYCRGVDTDVKESEIHQLIFRRPPVTPPEDDYDEEEWKVEGGTEPTA